MQLIRQDKPKIGDCESCDLTNTEVWRMHGNMWLCATCRAKELELAQTTPVTPLAAVHTIQQFAKVDQTITLQADVYNAATVPFVELRAAIYANPNIADANKQSEYVRQLNDHMIHLKRVLFETQTSLRACQTIGQSAAQELHESERAKYSEFDINYKPTATRPASVKKAASAPPKQQKAKSTGKADAIAAFEAAKKYPGMDGAHVSMYMLAHKCSAEEAAKLVSQSGLYKPTTQN